MAIRNELGDELLAAWTPSDSEQHDREVFQMNDPCLERGVTVAYNEPATTATATAVKAFLVATLQPGQ